MEHQKYKGLNNKTSSSKSLYNIINEVNKHQYMKKNSIENYKSLSDDEENKNNGITKENNLKAFINNEYTYEDKLIPFYDSNEEKLSYFSKKLEIPKVFDSSLENYKFYCSYNSFMNNRPYNEDRILINCQKNKKTKMHLFAIFDGHAGDKCCNFLTENFGKILFSNKNIFNNLSKALKETYITLEKNFKEFIKPKNLLMPIEKSGSCALSILCVKNKIYCANAGDSRALYSENSSKEVYQISYEHKPQNEEQRIKKAGGSIGCMMFGNIWRLFPGGIAVRKYFIYNIYFLDIQIYW